MTDEPILRLHDENPDSDRVMLSRRAAFQALNELAKEKDFNSITAGDIIRYAGISRSTFYRYFSDKFDLVNWSYKYYLNIHPHNAEKYYSYETGLMAHLIHLRDFRACYASALKYTGQNALLDAMYQTNEEYMLNCYKEVNGPDTSYEELCAVRVAAAGSTKIIERWIAEGFEQRPEDVTAAIMANLPPKVLAAL